jgi:hypothetical protein
MSSRRENDLRPRLTLRLAHCVHSLGAGVKVYGLKAIDLSTSTLALSDPERSADGGESRGSRRVNLDLNLNLDLDLDIDLDLSIIFF